MGLHHTVRLAYGIEIPSYTSFEQLETVLAQSPATTPVSWLHLGDFDRLFLAAWTETVEANASAEISPHAYTRHEIPAWNAALHLAASRLGHPQHPLPRWLVLHDHS